MKLVNIHNNIINTEQIAYATPWYNTSIRIIFYGLPEINTQLIIKCKTMDEVTEALQTLLGKN